MWSMSKKFYHLKNFESDLASDDKKHLKDLPTVTWFERNIADTWGSRLMWGAVYAALYVFFVDTWWQWFFLPIHFIMGPIQGTIVNWVGHKYGYQNFHNGDDSKNTLVWDLVLLGELFQNNHHKHPSRPKFSWKRWEFDSAYPLIYLFNLFRVIRLKSSYA